MVSRSLITTLLLKASISRGLNWRCYKARWDFSEAFVPQGSKKGCLVKLKGRHSSAALKKKKEEEKSTPTKHTCTKSFHFHACRANKTRRRKAVPCCASQPATGHRPGPLLPFPWEMVATDSWQQSETMLTRENRNGCTFCLCLIHTHKCTNLYRAMFIVHSYTKLSWIPYKSFQC